MLYKPKKAFSRSFWFGNCVFMFVLFCLSLWSSHVKKRKLVALLAGYLYVYNLRFHVFSALPRGVGRGQRSLTVTLPGDLFFLFVLTGQWD